MNRAFARQAYIVLVAFAVSFTGGCGYNSLQSRDESVKSSWAQVLNVYRKRADLVPNLVSTVQGYASHEKDVLTDVTRARASVGSIKLPENPSEADVKQFSEQQKEMSGALGRLLLVSERYPDLKADKSFLQLQTQLTDIENQIVAARNRYIREVRGYNVVVRSFPTNLTAMMFGMTVKPQLDEGDTERIKKPPTVKFGKEMS